MPKGQYIKDITGKRYNHLIVLKKHTERYNGQIIWTCQCDCGKIVNVPRSFLTTGAQVRCGRDCPKFGVVQGEAAFNSVYKDHIRMAQRRHIVSELSKEQFRFITSQHCFYCGCPPSTKQYRKYLNGNYTYNGIDRVDNLKGYIIENVVPCCWTCNRAKAGMETQEFKEWIIRAYNHWASK